MLNKLVNTTTEENRPDWLFGQAPDLIKAQEARGQDQLVMSEMLPTQISAEDKKLLETAGIRFGQPEKNDPLFCKAALPTGWSKQPTDHSMWSTLVDENGIERASIFYKAAFYDRRAFMSATKQK